MSDHTPTFGAFPLSMQRRKAEDVCKDFEAALRKGESPRLEDYLEQVAVEERETLLNRLLAL
ncbi:MAG: hypothetical protein NZM31_06235, partial [Gemmatales bacterium]|nr:hypothetical protein [Gemmatales bacterium]MDW8386597.1 hypothetical protein [Gemmatales bacterium]